MICVNCSIEAGLYDLYGFGMAIVFATVI